MPGVNSWNSRWSGEGREYVIVRSLGRSKGAGELEAQVAAASPYGYDFGDGWRASVSAKLVTPAEARKLRRESAGFAGYDWMVDSIIDHGEILVAAVAS